jgi:hypothetical protein
MPQNKGLDHNIPLKRDQQSMIAETNESAKAKNGFNQRGNSGVQSGIIDTKGKR